MESKPNDQTGPNIISKTLENKVKSNKILQSNENNLVYFNKLII